MILLVVVLYLLALVFCGWLFWQSVKLIIRGFQRAFRPSLAPSALMKIEFSSTSVPAWTARMVGDHIAHCQECRESYVTGTLPLLAPETVARIVGICDVHLEAQ